MLTFSLLLTIYAGFIHAFEADHLLAVSNIVSQRNNLRVSLKDGIYWGLGHSSTIFLIGLIMIVFKLGISPNYFHYLEALVGIMLIVLAGYRLAKLFRGHHSHHHPHDPAHPESHYLAYVVGLVHGLAGSGALVVLVISQMKGAVDGMLYLVIFAIGCIGGMLVAAGLFGIPFSKKIIQARSLQIGLVLLSSSLCLVYGTRIVLENLAKS